jgi:hypothetical protein
MDLIVSELISAAIKTIISQPLDTIKTWKQNSSLYTPKFIQRILSKYIYLTLYLTKNKLF